MTFKQINDFGTLIPPYDSQIQLLDTFLEFVNTAHRKGLNGVMTPIKLNYIKMTLFA